MAAGIIAKPGTSYGPCMEPCNHTDCNKTKNMANSLCNECGLKIDYDTRFYNMGTPGDDEKLYHVRCVES